MERQTVVDQLINFIAKRFGLEKKQLNGSTDLFKTIAVDSIEALELILEMEDVFQTEISDADVAQFQTIDDVADFILNQVN